MSLLDVEGNMLFDQKCIIKIKEYQEPVVQSIVSITISLRHKFVKQISAKVTNTQLFLKNVRILCSAKDSHIFSTKNNSVFVILMFEILTKL